MYTIVNTILTVKESRHVLMTKTFCGLPKLIYHVRFFFNEENSHVKFIFNEENSHVKYCATLYISVYIFQRYSRTFVFECCYTV